MREVRRRGMARRLDKIEKEMGYCEIKLEKERRLRKQIIFIENDREALDHLVDAYRRRGLIDQTTTGRFKVGRELTRSARERFLAAGLLEILQEEREILTREREDLLLRLQHFTGFESKRSILEDEKRKALKNISPAHSARLRKVNEDFKKVEKVWNSLTEDMINIDEGLFFLERNLDYLRSARTYLISAKGSFDIESWLSGGYLSDLFRHSTIGRAKEMADGADRNLKLAQKELVCISSMKVHSDQFQRVLVLFLEALFEDIFVVGKLEKSFQVFESALAVNIKLVEQVKAKRQAIDEKVQEAEKLRNEMFTELGAGRSSSFVV